MDTPGDAIVLVAVFQVPDIFTQLSILAVFPPSERGAVPVVTFLEG